MNENLTILKQLDYFSNIIKKLTLNQSLDEEELTYALSCAIIFIKEYGRDKRKIQHLNFGYFIVLKIALYNEYYLPLFDISVNLGLYPISRFIMEKKLTNEIGFSDIIVDVKIDDYNYGDIVETFKQKKYREYIVNSSEKDLSYIAPTSFGKSSLVVEVINKNKNKKIGVIVPTKSLILQTFNNLKKELPDTKIIFHDEMYDNEESIVAVFTQERALRLMSLNKKFNFDILIVDEAHNLLDKSHRSILLTRLLRRNKFRNFDTRFIYLSPLIEDSNNLKFDQEQVIYESKINFNIKDPDICEFKESGEYYKYNRFLDDFYLCGKSSDYIEYIIANAGCKNFLYLWKPKKVEELSLVLCERLIYLSDPILVGLSELVAKNIHEDFYCVDFIKKGLIYLHGKLPDLIKEYLEYKFKTLINIKYVISNTVILEGINLPIDTLFVMNTYKLQTKGLINLIGRVNRLNEVFDSKENNLKKLNPKIHFINEPKFSGKSSNMGNKIRKMKSGLFKDVVENPILINYEGDCESGIDVVGGKNESILIDRALDSIKDREDFLIFNENKPEFILKSVLIESGMSEIYKDFDVAYSVLSNRIEGLNADPVWLNSDIVDKIYLFFITGLEDNIINNELSRLNKLKARNFYRMFVERLNTLHLKDHIRTMLAYFYSIKDKDAGAYFYVGESYGEFSKLNENYQPIGKNVFVNLSEKSNKELVNIALIKIKIESDFVSYSLNKFINVMNDLSVISEADYNKFIYGSEKREFIDFVKAGLSGAMINHLVRESQIDNLYIGRNGYLAYKNDFIKFVRTQDDLIKFELGKYLSFI